MGAIVVDGHSINGTDGRAIRGWSIDVPNIHTNYESRESTSRMTCSANTLTPEESPQAKQRSHKSSSNADSLQTAKALGSVCQQEKDILDMVCVGFGPASLAIAIALADAYSKSSCPLPKILFIEKQEKFSWHSGMQLPSAKMQISFLKDLATPRDPTSPYTFINYLHSKGRLNQFINLGTFLPTRLEYEDYMRWCADQFEGVVKYGSYVTSVDPGAQDPVLQKTRNFHVKWRHNYTLETGEVRTRHVVVAAGGQANIPDEFKPFTALPWHRVGHSSQYSTSIKALEDVYRRPQFLRQQQTATEELLKARERVEEANLPSQEQQKEHTFHFEQKLARARGKEENCEKIVRGSDSHIDRPRFVIVGNGQSAAEIFSDLWTRFPKSKISMIIKGAALRPSDDSPFVNEIFEPERVDEVYRQIPEERKQAIALDKGTNYGVVRLELLEHIYEQMYMQRIQDPDPANWRCKILSNRKVTSVSTSEDESSLVLRLSPTRISGDDGVEELACEHVFVATGYTRNAYLEILKATRVLLPESHHGDALPVGRNYGIMFDTNKVDSDAGIWLQGCNESTHGLSDTLLSILAVRGGEIVQSIFGDNLARNGNE